MSHREFLGGRVTLYPGDCRTVLAALPEASVDSVVCDPPYHLTSIVKRFGGENAAPAKSNGATGVYKRASSGFMGKQWDGGDVAFQTETWAEVFRVLKPGGHLLAFSGTRTYHRMVCAIEDAGFEIRDQIGWAYGSGFPKSHDVSKALDGVLGKQAQGFKFKGGDLPTNGGSKFRSDHPEYQPYAPATEAAKQWEGWGTALKPAWEPIVLARKPLAGTVAENVLRYGTGALNIDGCRVEGAPQATRFDPAKHAHDGWRMNATGAECYARAMGREGEASAERRYAENGATNFAPKPGPRGGDPLGRWPANLVLSIPEDEYQLRRFVTADQKRELYRWLSENP